MSCTKKKSLVIDAGSSTCKIGLSTSPSPQFEFKTITGRPTYNGDRGMLPNITYVGSDAQSRADNLNLCYPITRGVVTNWESMERIYDHIFHRKLQIDPEEYSVLLTNSTFSPKIQKEKIAEVMFEKFSIPRLFLGNQGILSLIATGRITGVTVDCGDGMSEVVPVNNDCVLHDTTTRLDFAGSDLTDLLMKMLNNRENPSPNLTNPEIVRDIKEKLCFIKNENEIEDPATLEKTYTLPDGQTIAIEKERYLCPEALFKPHLAGKKGLGIHEIVDKSITFCEENNRRDLYRNILLAGGTTLIPGMKERLQEELQILAPLNTTIKVIDAPNKKDLAWIGGSIAASLSSHEIGWISLKEYYEHGSRIVHQKCP